jgi:hypothetical protein
MDDPSGDPAGDNGRGLFYAFAWLTHKLFGNSFLVVAGGAVGGMTLFLVTTSVAWTLNVGGLAVVAGLIAIPVGYLLTARLVRGLTRQREVERHRLQPPGVPAPPTSKPGPSGVDRLVLLAGVVLGILAFVLAVAKVGAPAAPAPSPSPSAALVAGVCLTANVIPQGVEAPWNGIAVDCASPHQIELIAVIASTATSFPSEGEWQAMSASDCHAAFLEYVGRPFDRSRDNLVWWGPSSDGWSAGNHDLVCGVYAPSGQTLSGSVKGTGR